MVTCHECGNRVSMSYSCNYCGNTYCSNCRLPEAHNCIGASTSRSTSKSQDSPNFERITTQPRSSSGWRNFITLLSIAILVGGIIAAVAVSGAYGAITNFGEIVPGSGGNSTVTANGSSLQSPNWNNSQATATDRRRLNTTKVKMVIIEETNKFRGKKQRLELRHDQFLSREAYEHSMWMAENNVLEHSGDGYYSCEQGSGENIAYTYPFIDIQTERGVVNYGGNETRIGQGLVKQWINSRGHRRNMLRGWSKIGVGIAVTKGPDGYTKIYATQAFCGDISN